MEHCGVCKNPLTQVQLAKLETKRNQFKADNEGKGMITGINTSKDWTKGRRIAALPQSHPDHFVESPAEMERMYKKNGISMETGDFVDEASKNRAVALAAKHHKPKKTRKK